MKRPLILIAAGTVLAVAAGTAAAHGNVGFSVSIGAPVYAPPPVYYTAPPVYYAPPPAYYAPPAVYYGPPRVYYRPPAVYYGPRHGHGHGRGHGYYGRRW